MLNTKQDILKNFEELNTCWSTLSSIVGTYILWKSMGTINCLITSIFKISYFMFNKIKELLQVWNGMSFNFLGGELLF